MSHVRFRHIALIALLFAVIGSAAMALYPRSISLFSPVVEAAGQQFDEERLQGLAVAQFRHLGLQGEPEHSETYFITLGQWYTLNDIVAEIPEGFSRDMPVYVYKATGKFQLVSLSGRAPEAVTQDRVIIALLADTGMFIGHRSYDAGAADFLIDVKAADNGQILIPSTLIPLAEGEATPVLEAPIAPRGALPPP